MHDFLFGLYYYFSALFRLSLYEMGFSFSSQIEQPFEKSNLLGIH